jgi:Uma2 family endonuclease
MATVPERPYPPDYDYPDSDGKPMAETPRHRDNLAWLVEMLRTWFLPDPMVYVSGNMLLYYVPGDRRRHVSPDVFVVRGIVKDRAPERRCYLVWEEDKAPDTAIELTSKSTRNEDLKVKFQLYQNVLKIQEYFLFDPYEDYLRPSLQGYRLRKGKYAPIRAVGGRLPSKVLGLHLERGGLDLRLYNPETRLWLPNPAEERAARERAELETERERVAREQAEVARAQAEAGLAQAEAGRAQAEAGRQLERVARELAEVARAQADAEIARLRQELEALRRDRPDRPRRRR